VENTGWEERGKVCYHVQSSEGGSRCMCRLRTVSIGPCATSIDDVLVHIGFMGSRKLSSFDDRCVG
jgi:hypothetical protein